MASDHKMYTELNFATSNNPIQARLRMAFDPNFIYISIDNIKARRPREKVG